MTENYVEIPHDEFERHILDSAARMKYNEGIERWTKSQLEIAQEQEGFKLFDHCPISDYWSSSMFTMRQIAAFPELPKGFADKFQHLVFPDGSHKLDNNVFREFHRACDADGKPKGGYTSFYIHAPKLIIPERTVIRNWETLEDRAQ